VTLILVVDDEPDLEALILQKFRRQLRDGDFAFLFARDGVEALETASRHPGIDLVLADINMPRMDGLTLLARLQEADDPLATVIVSAYGDMANIRTAMNRGAFDFLTKPIDLADLDATVAKTLRHVAAFREARARRLAAERAHAALARYFSPNLAAELAGAARAQELGAQRREVTAIFTDVTGFTALVETLSPARLGDLLNGYFGGMTEIVFAHGGTVMKVMGDALQVLFGAPGGAPDHAARAVDCALALDDFAGAFSAMRQAEGIGFGTTRIGLHAGEALVGDFGGGRYFDYTAYGDTINVAARLEAANKALGTRICASDAVAQRVAGFRGRPAGDLMLRGRSLAVGAHEPLSAACAVAPAIAAYRDAFARMQRQDPGALDAFAALAAEDPLAAFHAQRLRQGRLGAEVDVE
jgi:adenylate cyclase